jgi:hypothetical protein
MGNGSERIYTGREIGVLETLLIFSKFVGEGGVGAVVGAADIG